MRWIEQEKRAEEGMGENGKGRDRRKEYSIR